MGTSNKGQLISQGNESNKRNLGIKATNLLINASSMTILGQIQSGRNGTL